MFKKIIREGESIPEFYGLAYRDILRREAVCYPIVINLVIRYLRELYFIVASPPGLTYFESEAQEAYRRGYEDGQKSESRRQKDKERNKDDALMEELEGYIMGYLRSTFKEKP